MVNSAQVLRACTEQRCHDCRRLYKLNYGSLLRNDYDRNAAKSWVFCGLLLGYNQCCPGRNVLMSISPSPPKEYCDAIADSELQDITEVKNDAVLYKI